MLRPKSKRGASGTKLNRDKEEEEGNNDVIELIWEGIRSRHR